MKVPPPVAPRTAPDGVWIPAGASFVAGGRQITGGMVYIGSTLRSLDGEALEPALINPSLPVAWHRPDWTGAKMPYWPSYHRLNPEQRAAYLSWLAAGRRSPGVYIGFVFLFFYGLERRALKDITGTRDPELPLLMTEVEALRSVYGADESFDRYSSDFLELLAGIMSMGHEIDPPAGNPATNTWKLPWSVRLGVGRLVADGEPISAEWALSYLLHHPDGRLRTPAIRCRREFDELFKLRYRTRFGDGLVVTAPSEPVVLEYRPATGGLRGAATIDVGAREVTDLTALLDPLRELGTECCDALDSYSRFVGKQPGASDSASAVALLPRELLADRGGPIVESLREFTGHALSGNRPAVVLVDDLLSRFLPGIVGPIGKKDVVALTSLLARIDVGMEPDPRFGAPTAKFGTKVVLFRLGAGSPAAPSRSYSAALSLVHLTAAVAVADGAVSEEEQRQLVAHVETALGLDEVERARIEAHLVYLAHTKIGAALIRKQVEALPVAQRQSVGNFLVSVATADGVVTPAEITTLVKLFAQLGLEEADVYRQLHTGGTDPSPVQVRNPAASPSFPLPPLAESAPASAVQLDSAKVQQRLAETAFVSAMLADIFEDGSAPAFAPPIAGTGASEPAPALSTSPPSSGVWGLDARHSALAMALAEKPTWGREEAEDLSTALGLPLLDGALDRINEAALEACGDTLIDGDDALTINVFAAEELR